MKDKLRVLWWIPLWVTFGLLLLIGPVSPSSSSERDIDLLLIAAGRRDEANTVKRLLAQGASIHARDGNAVTALIAAAYQNHLEVAELLIKAGADVNAQDDTQQSAYLIATSEGYLELLKLTLETDGDVHSLDSYNGTGLIRAADRGHVGIIKELLKTDIPINHVNRLGLDCAAGGHHSGDGGPRHTKIVRLLVQAGADVNLADSNVAHARRQGYRELMSILASTGAR